MKEESVKNLKVVLIILSILAILIPVALAFGNMSTKVDNLEKAWISKEPSYTEKVNNLDSRIIELEKIAAGTEVSLNAIDENIKEIKSDIKDILKNLK